MKISLITIKSLYNYGAILQNFALFTYLKNNNFDVQVIDYYPKKMEERSFFKRQLMKLLTISKIFKIKKFNKKINYTSNHYSNIEELKKNPPEADVYIVGSDQVWNSRLLRSLDPSFFLDFIESKKKISYASSIAWDDLDLNELKVIRNYLDNFSHISVREESAKNLLTEAGVTNIHVVLDPVFLLEKEEYKKFIIPISCKKYLLIYSFEKNPVIEKIARDISKKLDLEIIEIGNFRSKYSHDKYFQNIGVGMFLSLIYNATFIVTSSFHGAAFSILFNKQFVAVEPSVGKTRIENIMKIFNLDSQLIPPKDDLSFTNLLKPIDYKEVNRLIEINSNKSKEFLNKAITS